MEIVENNPRGPNALLEMYHVWMRQHHNYSAVQSAMKSVKSDFIS
jgi:hypothetical protein